MSAEASIKAMLEAKIVGASQFVDNKPTNALLYIARNLVYFPAEPVLLHDHDCLRLSIDVTPFPPENYLLKNRQDAKDAKKKKEQER